MSQFAYLARTTAGTDALTPSTWPYGWQYPGDSTNTGYPTTPVSGGNIPGIPWPPNWPPVIAAGAAVNIDVPATISIGTHAGVVECWITINASETAASIYAHHLLMVTVNEAAVERALKKSGGAAYVTAIFYQVSNYAGNRWGFSQTIDFDASAMTIGDTFNIVGKLVTAVANPSGQDSWNVIS